MRALRYAQLSSELTATMITRQARPHVMVHCTTPEPRYHEKKEEEEEEEPGRDVVSILAHHTHAMIDGTFVFFVSGTQLFLCFLVSFCWDG